MTRMCHCLLHVCVNLVGLVSWNLRTHEGLALDRTKPSVSSYSYVRRDKANPSTYFLLMIISSVKIHASGSREVAFKRT